MDKSATDEFDCRADYTQFLQESRENLNQESLKKQSDWDKKSKKSWKTSLFSWLKNDKKSKSIKKPTHVSGPLEATVGGKAQRAASGPLIGRLGSRRSPEEYEVPYMCLGRLNNPQSYGPVYLVT